MSRICWKYSRREVLKTLGAVGAGAILRFPLFEAAKKSNQPKREAPKQFRVWIFSDAHVGRDLKYGNGRESLADAIRQSESPSGFDWDIALNLGDISGNVGLPKDEEGSEIVKQFGVLKKHRREQVYDLGGNHDRSGLDD